MKPYFIIILLAICVVVATALQASKQNKPDELDSFGKGITQLQAYFQATGKIGFKGEPVKGELLTWARFIAAPAYISPEPADTTLVIQYRNNSDTSMLKYMVTKQILKQVIDSQYIYSIVINR